MVGWLIQQLNNVPFVLTLINPIRYVMYDTMDIICLGGQVVGHAYGA